MAAARNVCEHINGTISGCTVLQTAHNDVRACIDMHTHAKNVCTLSSCSVAQLQFSYMYFYLWIFPAPDRFAQKCFTSRSLCVVECKILRWISILKGKMIVSFLLFSFVLRKHPEKEFYTYNRLHFSMFWQFAKNEKNIVQSGRSLFNVQFEEKVLFIKLFVLYISDLKFL